MSTILVIKGFELSTDYDQLWNLIRWGGFRIPAWVYRDEYDMWDIVEVKYQALFDQYIIGTRGVGFEGFENTPEGFKKVCDAFALHYVQPKLIITDPATGQ